ncbi:kinetochore-associated protein 1 [Latimeria chalumnae]|uniref:kinetochore-associated protein 1 n=1 Tax=Latimeria chalumnae TaxID=7897 RepID=UPI00313CB7A3
MWNDIELLTNDDTGSGRLSIDSRQESGTALYQVDTIVKIASNEKVLSNPKIYACNNSDGCIIIADKSVILLNQICQSVQLQLQFDTDVDVAGLCEEGRFLLVGEKSGNLQLIHVTSKQTLLTNALIQKPPEQKQRTYLNLIIEQDSSAAGTYHVFLLTNDGFFCIMYLLLAKIQQAIETKDFTAAKQFQGQIKTGFVSTESYHTLGCQNSIISVLGDHHLIIGGSGDCVLSKWRLDPLHEQISIQNVVHSDMINGIRKCQVLDNLIFVLDEDNVLSMWDAYTFVLVWFWPSLCVQDFLLILEGDSSSVTRRGNANLKLIALTTPDKKQMKNLVVYSLPGMNLLYSLEVSDVSSLVQTGMNMDTIYLLEGVYEKERSPQGTVSFLVMRCLTEALPENRLSRLLHQHRFEEAEKFAIQFGLDVELVYKVKLNIVLEQLASASVGTYGHTVWQELVEEAKGNLHKILDDQFVVPYCINTPWPTFETTLEMLNYAKARILKKDDRKHAPLPEENYLTITEVLRAQARLSSFYGAFGPEKFSGISWIEFLNNEDIFSDILLQLEERNLSCAQYLWLRHQVEFETKFDIKMLESLLNAIPTDIPSQDLFYWFKSVVVPFIRRVVPKGKKILAKWLEHRARTLELTEKENWPENGLNVAELYFVSRNPNVLGLATSWLWIPLKDDSECKEVQQLKKLVQSLQELVDLYRKYNCRIALSEFEKETTTTVVFRMLDKVLAPELVPSALKKVITPYIQEHNLQQEQLLLQYIKDLLDRCSSRSASLFETAWEAKAMAVLSCMTDVDLIFDAVLQIMYGAVVPWSEAVEQLVKQHLQMNHPKVKLLHESYRLMEMKKLLRGYGIRSFNLSNVKQIMRVVKYILKQDLPSSLEDALKVTQAYMLSSVEVYLIRITHLIEKDRREECITLLKSLSPSDAENTAERLAIWAQLVLRNHPNDSKECKMHQMVAQTLVEVLKFLLTIQKENPLKTEQCERSLKMFEAIVSLQDGFDIFLSLEDYENRSLLSQLCEEHIENYESMLSRPKSEKDLDMTSSTAAKTKNVFTETRLYRLALLLQVTEQELGAELAMRALSAGKVEKAVNICRELFKDHCNEQTGRVLFQVAQRLCQMLEASDPVIVPAGMNLPVVIHEIACQGATICNPELLLDCQELCKSTLAAMDVYRQCQIEDYGFISKTSCLGADRDPYEEWTYEDFFSEDGIILDPLMVLPVLYEITTTFVPYSPDKKQYPLDCANLANCPNIKGENLLMPVKTPVSVLLQNLRECSQLQLALRLVFYSFGTLVQHVFSNNMDAHAIEKLWEEQALKGPMRLTLAMSEKFISVVKEVSMALLHKVFNCHVVDHDLALGYCFLVSKKDVYEKLWDVINNSWQNYNRIMAVAVVGAQLAMLQGEEEENQKFQSLVTDAEWGIQLNNFGISFQSSFRQCSARKNELIPVLVQNPNMTSEMLLKYCSTYNLNSDAALQLYIEMLLLHSTNANHSERALSSESLKNSHSEPVAKTLQMIPLLKSTKDLVISLSGILLKLDPYDYETIEGILMAMQTADEKATSIQLDQALGLLQLLKSYKRISLPLDLEHQYTLDHAICLSSASQQRLPFHLLFFNTTQCFWNIISAEITDESFPTLLLISKLMKVSLDKLYMSAVKHVFEKTLKPNVFKQSKEGRYPRIAKETIKTVKTIQSYLLSITKLEWAAAICHRMVQDLPTGPEKNYALKFCMHLTQKWQDSLTPQDEAREKAGFLLNKLTVLYQRSATENVLIAHSLNSAQYLKLTDMPSKLIESLFGHDSIEQRVRNPIGRDYPDIHAAANEVAEINNLHMNKIRDVLLEKWLCPSTQPVVDGKKTQDFFSNIQEDPELIRVLYLLQPYPLDYSTRILFAIATSATSPISVVQLTFAHRSRALQCLIHIAGTEAVVALFKKPIEKVKYYLKCCIYLAEFEILNIPYTFESFHSGPKEGMIKGLWKNHSHEPRAVRLVVELSLEYQVFDPQLWNGVLQKLLGFNMISYLRKVLVAITGVQSLWPIPVFSRAWRSAILAPFLSASCPPSPKQLEACYESFVLLIKCPVLGDLDLVGIAKQYVQLDLPAFAVGSLLLIPYSEKREQQIQGFLSLSNPETVLQQVVDHMTTGEVAGFASQIKKLLLDYLIKAKQYEKLMKTKHASLLKQHVLKTNVVKLLVDDLVNRSCLDEAAVLVTEHLQHHGKPIKPNLSPLDVLKEFLQK